MSKLRDNKEVEIFQEYLRIASVHPDVDYTDCVSFLKNQAAALNLPVKVVYPGGPTKPIVLISWVGSDPSLPSILLNSHMDVVPVFPEHWTYPPFEAHIDKDGKIFARGTQDMKSVGMQYLAVVRHFKNQGIHFKRSIHILFCPDEEIGGFKGMKEFVKTKDFESLNVGCALDEGGPSPTNILPLHYGERYIWGRFFSL
ncbi:ACY1.2 family protein [Megaselia abdita]